MKKYLLKVLIVVAMFIIVLLNNVFATTEDIKTKHWASETINEFIEKKYLSDTEYLYTPDEEISKGELTGIINCYFSYGEAASEKENLEIAERKGYLSNAIGSEKITREEIAVLFCKVLSLIPVEDTTTNFVDNAEISVWAKGYVKRLEQEEIIIGYPDMSYKPHKYITKAELVTILNRCVGIGGRDIEIKERDIEEIQIDILEYEDGKVITLPIEYIIELNSGDSINLAMSLPEGVNEENINIDVEDELLVQLDKEILMLTDLKNGKTKIIFKTADNKYKKEYEIIIKD